MESLGPIQENKTKTNWIAVCEGYEYKKFTCGFQIMIESRGL